MGQSHAKVSSNDKRKRVLVVGAGAAGTAAAYSLSLHPDKFHVELWEKCRKAGGQALSSDIPGGTFVNYGVQGGCSSYRNVVNLMKIFGLETSPVHMMISFGKDETAWTNYTETDLIKRMKPEIKRFEGVIKHINRFETYYLFRPIAKVLKGYDFSDDFRNLIVFPLVALFFGTGNQTPNVSAAIIARVFLDDDLRLFDYDSECFLSQKPEMFAFPNLEEMYETIIKKSGIAFYPDRPVEKVVRKDGKVYVKDQHGAENVFDDIIFACDAETILKVLEEPSYWERKCLSNVTYYNDITITHEDEEYMRSHYQLNKDKDQYFIRTDPEDREKIEMSFNLSNYQPQLKDKSKIGNRDIYQTIFLDDNNSDAWTMDRIKEDKVLLRTWWRQFAHTWKHFAFAVPFVRYMQGTKHTYYCGSYTLINTHEIAVISGLAAAHRLGAPYPFSHDELATKQFDQYLMVIHGKARKGACQTFKAIMLAPLAKLFALFLLILGSCLGSSQ